METILGKVGEASNEGDQLPDSSGFPQSSVTQNGEESQLETAENFAVNGPDKANETTGSDDTVSTVVICSSGAHLPPTCSRCIRLMFYSKDAEENGTPFLESVADIDKVPVSKSDAEILLNNQPSVRLAQKYLLILLHAHACRHMESTPHGKRYRNCKVPYCKATKSVVDHMMDCKASVTCNFPRCFISWQIIRHYNWCRTDTCQICRPFGKKPKTCSAKHKK
ncbi:unnamed protein product, partial [Iphiclides podalirius]